MRLSLSVLTLQDQAPFTSMTHTFDQSGGSVGRHQRADWVLLDDKKFLSGEHFSINCDGKDFFVVDTSTNGTFINDSLHPLGQNNSHRLREKDSIRIGEYVILCSIFSDAVAPQSDFPVSHSADVATDNDPFFSSGGHFSDTPSHNANSQDDSLQTHDPYAASSKSSFVDPNMAGTFGQANTVEDSSDPFFSSSDSFSPEGTPFSKEQDKNIMVADTPLNIHTPLPNQSVNVQPQGAPLPDPTPVAPVSTETEEPDAFDFLNDKDSQSLEEPVIKEPKEPVAPPAKEQITKVNPPKQKTKKAADSKPTPKEKASDNSATATESDALKMFLKGAGITQKHLPSDVPAETFEIIGKALKEVLQGTIGLLRARAETKNHLHLDRTIIGNVENNPLKFMPNAEQVIVHLLTSENSDKTYTPLDKALEEAFDDIMAHQYAMTVATQGALKGVIKQHFSPKNLADNMAKNHPISSKIPLQRQAKLWNMFESLYDDVEKEAAESFQKLLDNEVSNAYEKQLLELKSLRIGNKNNSDFPE